MLRAMKLRTVAILGLVAAATGLHAQTLAQGERDRALSDLYATRKQFLDSVAGLTEAQWNFKAAPDRWSIAECAEHIAVTEDLVFNLITGKIMKSPADPSKRAEVKGKDETVLKQMVDRSHKATAPPELVPAHRFATPQAAVDHFRESRDRTLDYVRSTPDDLRDHFLPHPIFGMLDGYQWVLIASGHSARHTAQINEVKASPGYPK